jgi:hypothetical protein
MRYIMCMIMFLSLGCANAHEWTPTYPKLSPSYVSDVVGTTMSLYNSRKDIEYYEFSVYDRDFNPIRFATAEKIISIKYLERKTIEIYVRKQDVGRGMYICSESKVLKDDVTATVVRSRICSKVK